MLFDSREASLMEVKIDIPTKWSHQPFLNEFDGKKILFFCYAENVIESTYGESTYYYTPWKIVYGELIDNKVVNIKPLQTDFNSDDIECSPVFYTEADEVFVSFVGGRKQPEGEIIYHLYQMHGKFLNTLTKPAKVDQESVWCGYKGKKHIIKNWGKPETEIIDLIAGTSQEVEIDLFDTIQRIVPATEETILVTGRNKEKHQTILYDLKSECIGEIVASDSASLYKCCIFKDTVIYAKKMGSEFEERELYLDLFKVATY